MRGKIYSRVALGVALSVSLLGVLTSSHRAQADSKSHNPLGTISEPSASPEPAPAEQEAEGLITVIEKIPKPEKKEGAPPKPPAKQDRLAEELDIRAMFLKAQVQQAQEARARAERATNPAERQVLLKDAQLKTETVQSMTRTISGPPPAPQQSSSQSQGQLPGSTRPPGASPAGRPIQLKETWGALEQLKNSASESSAAAEAKSPVGAKARAAEAFKDGRAGAGGVALYKPATMLTPLEPAKMTTALVENDRLALVYDGQKLLFPVLDTQFLALAIRSVYGGEGLVKGKLLANEKNAVVLSTGKEQYGEVVWKKEFLPDLSESIKVGEEVELDLGPGVGVLSLPEPSHDRVTYYGPLKGNILGQVVQESDMVFSMYWYGVHWKTGKPIDPAQLPGYESSIENDLRQTVDPDAQMKRLERGKNWWEDTVWFVWTPDTMSLQLVSEKKEFEFVKATMKVNVWGVREDNVRPSSRLEGEYITSHYDEFARAFPVLARLREAAKAVAVVRWLKQNKVPLALAWAQKYPLTRVDTPDTIPRFSVVVHRDQTTGKPVVETP